MTGIVYTGSDGKKYTAGAEISVKNAGEGLYVIAEDSFLAARILPPERRTQERLDRIRVMVKDPRKRSFIRTGGLSAILRAICKGTWALKVFWRTGSMFIR